MTGGALQRIFFASLGRCCAQSFRPIPDLTKAMTLGGTVGEPGRYRLSCFRSIGASVLASPRRPEKEASESGMISGMHLDAAHPLLPLVSLAAGVFLLIAPRIVNVAVAVYLIVVGLLGLNGTYHFFK